ncbi:hypothetical protein BKN38_01640 [Helicobacter sp. CLO-3]|nr:hypothetical protein BA723_04860 [Helicobacter sp. CLO-3]OHU85290.1 hypothetical protein BKN38_01640 [Helicobacter sp. CLO-3]
MPFAPHTPHALYAGAPSWDFVEDLDLSKDEVYETSFTIEGMQKDLRLYWTLYKNYGLVVNLKYDKFPYQFVLYTDYKRKSFKIPLSKGGDIDKDAYALVSFREFDDKAKRASLGLFVMLPKAPSGGN